MCPEELFEIFHERKKERVKVTSSVIAQVIELIEPRGER